MSAATREDIHVFMKKTAPICGLPVEYRTREPRNLLIVYCANVEDARMWHLAFAADESRWICEDHPDVGKTIASSFAAWKGWHVMVHGSSPMHITVKAAAELVLVGGAS